MKKLSDIVNDVKKIDLNGDFKEFLEGETGKLFQKNWSNWLVLAEKTQELIDKVNAKTKSKKASNKKVASTANDTESDAIENKKSSSKKTTNNTDESGQKKKSGITEERVLSDLAVEILKVPKTQTMNYPTIKKAIVEYSTNHVEKKEGSKLIQLDSALKNMLQIEEDEVSHQNILKYIKNCFEPSVKT